VHLAIKGISYSGILDFHVIIRMSFGSHRYKYNNYRGFKPHLMII